MRQSRITMRNGTTHLVRLAVDDIERGARELLDQKVYWMRLLDIEQKDIVVAIPEISTIEDAGLWRAPSL